MRLPKARRAILPKTARATQSHTERDVKAANQAEAEMPAFEGGLLAITPLGVVGWARDLQAPANPLQVVLTANDTVVGTSLSNRFDLELVRVRIGPGVPGFIISLSRPLPSDYPVRLTLRDKTGMVLGTPLVLTDDSLFGPLHPEAPGGAYEGMVEGFKDGVLVGWACSLTQTDRPLSVELYDGNEQIAQQLADGYRGDLETAGKQQGRCAFSFEMPTNLLDGRVHSLRVVVGGTRTELANGPVQFGPLTTSTLVEEVTRLRQEVKRLLSLVEIVVSPSGRVQSEIVRILSERVAAFAEIQRDMVEKELDALRAFAFREDPAVLPAAVVAVTTLPRTASGVPEARQRRRHKVP
jgi:hypothetical protein